MSWKSVSLESQSISSSGEGSQVFRLHADLGTEDITSAFFASGPQNDEGTLGILDLPQEGDFYGGRLAKLVNPIVTRVSISQEGGTESIFKATVTYGDGGEGEESSSQDKGKEPWDREPQIQINGAFVMVDSFVDVSGRALTNSMGDHIWNPAPLPTPSAEVSIVQARRSSDATMMSRILQYNGKVNDVAYTLLGKVFPPYTLLVTITGQKQWTNSVEDTESYWSETISFKQNPRTYVGKYLDEGFHAVIDETGLRQRISTPISWDEANQEVNWDYSQPSSVPFPLNGNRKLLSVLGESRNVPEANAEGIVEVDLALSSDKAVMLNRYEYEESDFVGLL